MNREDIIRMAREADLYLDGENTQQPFWVLKTEDLERFAALVAAAEIENLIPYLAELWDLPIDAIGFNDMRRYAAAIRARGQT